LVFNIKRLWCKHYNLKTETAISFLKKKYDVSKAISLSEKRTFESINLLIDNEKYPEIITKSKELVLIDFFDKQIKDGKMKIFEL